MAEWRSQSFWYDANSPLAPGRPTVGGVTRFRVEFCLPHLVYTSVWRVAIFLEDSSRCWTWPCWELVEGVDGAETCARSRVTWGNRPDSPWSHLRSACPTMWILNRLDFLFFWPLDHSIFWPLEPPGDLVPCLYVVLRPNARVLLVFGIVVITGQSIQWYDLSLEGSKFPARQRGLRACLEVKETRFHVNPWNAKT